MDLIRARWFRGYFDYLIRAIIIERMKEMIGSLVGHKEGGATPTINSKNLLRVYQQMDEPEEKEGLWVKTNNPTKKVQINNKDYNTGISTAVKLADIPFIFYSGSASSVGNKIYLLGGDGESTTNYEYDTNSNIYTKKANSPVDIKYSETVTIDTNIWFTTTKECYVYKYDTLTNEYTLVSSENNKYSNGRKNIVTRDGILYLFSQTQYSYMNIWFIFDTQTNTEITSYTLESKEGERSYGDENVVGDGIAFIGNKFYFFYGTNIFTITINPDENLLYFEKIDPVIPYSYTNKSVLNIGPDCYLLGSTASGCESYFYKYNVDTQVFTKLTDLPLNFKSGSAVLSEGDIYLFGGENTASRQLAYKYDMISNNDLLVLYQNGQITTDKVRRVPDLYKYIEKVERYLEDGSLENIEVYRGDGISWRLPYTEVEYITFTGTQYINTKIKPTQNIKVEVKFKCVQNGSTAEFLFGSRTSKGSVDDVGIAISPTMLTIQFSNSVEHNLTFDYTTTHTLILSKDGAYLDDNLLETFNNSSFNSNLDMFLSGMNTNGSFDSQTFRGQIYYCKVWQGDNLIRDLVPAIDLDNKACFYDKANQDFYYNSGTGSLETN